MVFRISKTILDKTKEFEQEFKSYVLEGININNLNEITEWDFCIWPDDDTTQKRGFEEGQVLTSIEYGFIIGIINKSNIFMISPGWNTPEFVKNIINTEILYKKTETIIGSNYSIEFKILELPESPNFKIPLYNVLPAWLKLSETTNIVLDITYSAEITLGLEINIILTKNGDIYYTKNKISEFLDNEVISDIIIEILGDIYNKFERTKISLASENS